MELATYFALFIITYYNYFILDMLMHKSKRELTQIKNTELDNLRAIPAKTLEEQKAFLDLKFKKKQEKKKKFKWSWKVVWIILYTGVIYFIIFKIWEKIFLYFKIELQLWQAILFAVIFPLILNTILNKFNLQKSDISVFLRGGRKNDKK